MKQKKKDIFKQKYTLYGKTLYKIAYIHLKNPSDAEDTMQEAFIKLLYCAPKFKDAEHEKAWLIRVTINICKNIIKKHKRVSKINVGETKFQSDLGNFDSLLQKVLALPEKYKTVVHLFYYEDYSVAQISQILRIGQSAVKMRLMRGRELLRMELEEQHYEKRRL